MEGRSLSVPVTRSMPSTPCGRIRHCEGGVISITANLLLIRKLNSCYQASRVDLRSKVSGLPTAGERIVSRPMSQRIG